MALAGATTLRPGRSAPSGRASDSERCGVALPGRPAGQGNAALAGEHRADAGGQAASPSVCAAGG